MWYFDKSNFYVYEKAGSKKSSQIYLPNQEACPIKKRMFWIFSSFNGAELKKF